METVREPRAQKDAERQRLADYHATRCPRLKASLIEEYYWIAEYVARRYRERGEAHDDLVQVAALGLVAALERYDPDAGSSFPAFALPTATGEVRKHFRDRTWRVRVPRRLKDLSLEAARAAEELAKDLEREPTTGEIADRLDVPVELVEQARSAVEANHPLPVGTPAADTVTSLSVDVPADDQIAGAEEAVMVQALLATLAPRERAVVRLRFYADLSQDEIAARVGVSQPHVSRILRSALARLKRQLVEA
jgi:RNA polymerase sigma-B factor